MTTKVDRSRIIEAQVCPRKRYLTYHYQNRGVRSNRVNIPLTVGSCVHLGLEGLLSGTTVDLAVHTALANYDQECQSRSFAQEDLDVSFVYQENRAMIEALIRLYAKVQLPRLLERFEVLEVEKEIELVLAKGNGYATLEPDNIVLMSRPDAILRERSTGSIYVLSFKTSAGWMGEMSENQNRWDVQGISELVATEHWLESLVDSFEEEQVIKVSGIKMEHLIKGSYSKALTDQPLMNISKGQKFYNNLLIHPYANASQFAFGDYDLRFQYEWQDPYSGKTNRLGKDWKRCNIWELGEGQLAAWIDFLAEQEEGLTLLERMVVCPIEYYRNEEDVEEWLESAIFQEQRIQQDLESVEQGTNSLNQCFQKVRSACFNYNSPCQFIPICWEEQTVEGRLQTGELAWREPNHPGEEFEESRASSRS